MTAATQKVAVVTGAAVTEGGVLNIGGAIATELVADGAFVVLAEIDGEAAARLAERLNRGAGVEVARAAPTDVRSEEQIAGLVSTVLGHFDRLDVVVNNAGVFPPGDSDIAELDVEVWEEVMAVNARAPMLLTKHAIAPLSVRGGAVVNISSTHSFAGDSRLTAYGAAKAALNALTTYTATQYGRLGIRCNAVCPGTTLSPPVLRAPAMFRDVYARHTLNPSLNTPSDVAKVVAFLASEASHALNGMVVRADGGLLSHQPFVADVAEMP